MIRLEGVHKSFGPTQVLNGLDLEVKDGETFVLLGPSGMGKSVLLKHIIGLLRPDKGRILVDDIDISDLAGNDLVDARKAVGYVFQSGALINWLTVEENVALPLKEHTRMSALEIRDKVQRMLDLVHLSRDGKKFPDEISGGMRKRVGIARALVLDPTTLLFDEPTTGLDPVRSRSIGSVIAEMSAERERTNIIVTHDLDLAFDLADRIGFLHGGRIAVEGTPDEIAKTDNATVREFVSGHKPKGKQARPDRL